MFIDLLDPETNITYTVDINEEDMQRVNNEPQYAQALLQHAIDDSNSNIPNNVDDKYMSFDGNESTDFNCNENEDRENMIPECSEKFTWRYDDTLVLISAVESHYEELNHPKKRKYAWENISNELLSQNISVSKTACSKKWQNILRTYKSCKDSKKQTGRGSTRFLFYDKMDEFLGQKPNNSSPHSIDVLDKNEVQDKNIKVEVEADNSVTDDSGKENSESTSDEKQNVAKVGKNRKRKALITFDYLRKKYEMLEKKEVQEKQKADEKEKEKQEKKKREEEKMALLKVKYDLEERKVAALEALVPYKLKEK